MEANYFTIFYWFCHISTWIHHGCTRVPHPEPPSHLPPCTIPLVNVGRERIYLLPSVFLLSFTGFLLSHRASQCIDANWSSVYRWTARDSVLKSEPWSIASGTVALWKADIMIISRDKCASPITNILGWVCKWKCQYTNSNLYRESVDYHSKTFLSSGSGVC